MGSMDRMGILLGNLWWRNSDFNEGNQERSTKWRKLCGQINQRPAMQYKWLPNGLPVGAMDSMGIMHKNLWWGNSDRQKGSKKRSKRWRKLSRFLNQKPAVQYQWLPS